MPSRDGVKLALRAVPRWGVGVYPPRCPHLIYVPFEGEAQRCCYLWDLVSVTRRWVPKRMGPALACCYVMLCYVITQDGCKIRSGTSHEKRELGL